MDYENIPIRKFGETTVPFLEKTKKQTGRPVEENKAE